MGLGRFSFERPIEPPPTDPNAATTEIQKVLYGKIAGEITVGGIGVGVDLVLTQYGPVLAKLIAGVPDPVGDAGRVRGRAVRRGSGHGQRVHVTGLQGGLVFDADPLPVVEKPTDIFQVSELTDPLRVTTADIEAAVRDLALQNPTFSELIAAYTNVGSYADILEGSVYGHPQC